MRLGKIGIRRSSGSAITCLHATSSRFATGYWVAALRLTGDPMAAEDLQQETMIRGLALCQICGGPDDTKAYLFRSAANLWIDRLRRRKKEALLPEMLSISAPPPASGELSAEWLNFLARTLSPREFEVFILREVHGYTGPETARLLGATEAAVKMAACRARQRIQACAA